MQFNRIPLVPAAILKAHRVNEPGDTRFKAAARFLQSLWRDERGLPIGTHRSPKGKRRKLGSRIDAESAKQGGNFLTPDIAKLALRESVYREIGAVIEQERLWSNMLSSQPLCFNLFGWMKLDAEKANLFFRHMFPDYVAAVKGIYFEHSPSRGDPAFTDDNSAFDVFVVCITPDGETGFIAIEMKYSETMAEPLAGLRPRYDELSRLAGIYKDPEAPALRGNPVQQLWREHMLSRAMIHNGLYSTGRFVVIHPEQNRQCRAGVNAYREHLASTDPQVSGFQVVTLEDCIAAFRAIGDAEAADALHGRYLDFGKVEQAIFG
ncbi:hypothetical protein [Azonexus sp. R2A61]|uniref:PGN_0703 family putative restriction endonuclease n=1 Tax=Azonexus sp. R2A61 TaxID=2744443 RepID=UPI001F1E63C6|nr:hypothetical protein [Azonexus sp. R2A61]